jgi:hypothetical protein
MKKRLDGLTRIGRLQAKMRDLGQGRKAALEREQAALGEDLQALFVALESEDLANGALAALGPRRARILQKRLDALKKESESARHKAETHAIRARLAEEAAEAAAKAYRQQKERKELALLIECALARRAANQR